MSETETAMSAIGKRLSVRSRSLRPALRSLVDHAGLPVTLSTDLRGRLPVVVEATCYFVAAEALTNVARHSCASRARVDVAARRGWLCVEVADNGVGGANPAKGSGLRGLADRVAAVGGTFTIDTAGGSGTRLRAAIPYA